VTAWGTFGPGLSGDPADSEPFESQETRALREMIERNERVAYEGRVRAELGLDEGGDDGVD
jgi:hypothetical protein